MNMDEFYVHYVKPQASSNRTDTDWFTLMPSQATGLDKSVGLKVVAQQAIQFSVAPYTMKELSSKRHPHRLQLAPSNIVNIDLMQRGVGGDTGWGESALATPPYRIKPNKYQYGFWLMPWQQ
jgi:beta-galactosidase